MCHPKDIFEAVRRNYYFNVVLYISYDGMLSESCNIEVTEKLVVAGDGDDEIDWWPLGIGVIIGLVVGEYVM